MCVFTQFFRLGSICGMAFKLKTYQLLPQKYITLWDDILDIIGPVKKWPPKMRNLFFKQGLSHFERLKVCTFVYVNGLNPVMFLNGPTSYSCCQMKLHVENVRIGLMSSKTTQRNGSTSMFTTTDTSTGRERLIRTRLIRSSLIQSFFEIFARFLSFHV